MRKTRQSTMSSAVTYHKTEGKCIRAIWRDGERMRFISVGEDSLADGETSFFEVCPVCGKALEENKVQS